MKILLLNKLEVRLIKSLILILLVLEQEQEEKEEENKRNLEKILI